MGAAGSKRIVLSTMFNVRDLGGYQTPYGRSKFGRYLRAGDTIFLSNEERELLLKRGVRRVVDLRMGLERPELSDRFANVDGVAWMSASMADERTMAAGWTSTGRIVESILAGYRCMLSHEQSICEVMRFMAKADPQDCVLFHCAAGMDRTGLVSMLILGSVGVCREDLVADYAYSFASDGEVDEALATWDPTLPPPPHDGVIARIHVMFSLVDELVEQYGSIREYLLAIGVGEDDLAHIASHLVA